MKLLSKTLLVGLFVFAFAAPAAVLDFDSVVAPCCFSLITPGGPFGPIVTDGFLTVDGGVIMNGPIGWFGLETSSPNLYGTSDFLALEDLSFLPGVITGTFAAPVSALSFDVINGFVAASFTVNVYNAANAVIASAVLPLANFPGPGAVGSVSFVGLPGAMWFEVLSGQGQGLIDFAIDTVSYGGVIPEPSTFVLMGAGLLAIPLLRRMRTRGQTR